MLRVYSWMGLPANMISLRRQVMRCRKRRLEIWNEGEKKVSRWINIRYGFRQGESYSPVGFCLSEVRVCKLLQETKGYGMSQPGKSEVKRTHSFFIDVLKVYQESHKILKDVNETIVQASHDTGACYGVAKSAEVIFKKGKMVKGEGLQVLQERIKTWTQIKNRYINS